MVDLSGVFITTDYGINPIRTHDSPNPKMDILSN